MANKTSQEMIWSHEQCRILAQEMEKYPCLWDRRSDDYKKSVAKHDAKQAIGEKLKIPTYMIDAKIKSIISQFLREVKKERVIKTRSSNGPCYKSKWFLLPHLMYILNTREIRSVDSQNPEDLCIEVQDTQESLSDTEGVETDKENENFRINGEGHVSAGSSCARSFTSSSSKPTKRKSSFDDTLMKIVTLLTNSLSKLSKPETPSPTADTNEDEWNYFSGLVAKKMRSIQNPAIRIRAENEIYSVLLRAQADDIGCPILYLSNNTENTSD